MLGAVELGKTHLDRLTNAQEKKKPINKVMEDRQKKVDQEQEQKATDRKKLDERKKMLKEQLSKLISPISQQSRIYGLLC